MVFYALFKNISLIRRLQHDGGRNRSVVRNTKTKQAWDRSELTTIPLETLGSLLKEVNWNLTWDWLSHTERRWKETRTNCFEILEEFMLIFFWFTAGSVVADIKDNFLHISFVYTCGTKVMITSRVTGKTVSWQCETRQLLVRPQFQSFTKNVKYWVLLKKCINEIPIKS